MRFEFATSTRVLFGDGTLKEAAPAARSFGQRALLVTWKNTDCTALLLDMLASEGINTTLFSVDGEPTIEMVLAGLEIARENGCDLVIGLGGGSALDCGKAIAALLPNPGDIYDYLEVVGKGQPLKDPSAPYIAIPTTAGTGSEVTRNAVLGVKEYKVKVSLRGPSMLPRLAIVDPQLTYSLPPEVTASTGLDALTQVIEPFLSNASNPLTDAICREGIQRVARSLYTAYRQGDNPQARENMSLASLFGGMALANAKLGAVHGFAGPIGGMFPAPHGATCARLLPLVMQANLKALRQHAPQSITLARFDEVAQILTGSPKASSEDGIYWLHEFCEKVNIPPLSKYGISTADFSIIVAQARKASSMKGNPVELTDEELTEILEKAT
jgi:alcohol dehydrogenase class IV